MAKNHEISVYFSTKAIFALCHAPPELRNSNCAVFQTKGAIGLEIVVNRDKYGTSYKPDHDEDKTFSGSLVLDLRI